jgi:flagellar hook-basal body complex protein FliE
MSMTVSAIGIRPPDPVRPEPKAGSGGDFGSLLRGAMQNVERAQSEAAQSAGRFLVGDDEELHETALAAQRAELTLDLFLQTRNKVVAAYQEIMRMQM